MATRGDIRAIEEMLNALRGEGVVFECVYSLWTIAANFFQPATVHCPQTAYGGCGVRNFIFLGVAWQTSGDVGRPSQTNVGKVGIRRDQTFGSVWLHPDPTQPYLKLLQSGLCRTLAALSAAPNRAC